MVKFVLLLPKKKNLSRNDFMHEWKDVCVPMAAKIPGLRRYVINAVAEEPGGKTPRYDGIAELWFDDAASGQTALGSDQGKAVVEHMPKFTDMNNFVLSVTEEQVII